MNERFADSFVFLALLNRTDRKHLAAVNALGNSRAPLITIAWILTELADGLCSAKSRSAFVALEAKIKGDPRFTVISANAVNDPTKTGR